MAPWPSSSGTAGAGWAEGSPSLLELLITKKDSCLHPLIPSNHDNCRAAVILSPGQPPQGSSQREQRGLGPEAFLELLWCEGWHVKGLRIAPLPRPAAVWRGYNITSWQGKGCCCQERGRILVPPWLWGGLREQVGAETVSAPLLLAQMLGVQRDSETGVLGADCLR